MLSGPLMTVVGRLDGGEEEEEEEERRGTAEDVVERVLRST